MRDWRPFSSEPGTARWLVPEVVQTSAMDCGPAALKALLEGYGLSASYGRLREACQTDVDGTSIDTLEQIAGQLGLDAVQVMMPADHLLLPEAASLPAIAVVLLPGGGTHFLVIWRLHGRWIQVMDPSQGRRWMTRRQLVGELFLHRQPVAAADWRAWAESEGFLAPLGARLARLGLNGPQVEAELDAAKAAPGWRPLATLDAATRLVDALIQADGLEAGPEAQALLARFCDPANAALIPDNYWSVELAEEDPTLASSDPGGEEGEDDGPTLWLKGAVLIQVFGLIAADEAAEVPP
ncbi:MAG: cysteine peptidase family C39 domain-containing protein, partial [Candidatus Competibacterales bacterium]